MTTEKLVTIKPEAREFYGVFGPEIFRVIDSRRGYFKLSDWNGSELAFEVFDDEVEVVS